jgi:hypothetical protein
MELEYYQFFIEKNVRSLKSSKYKGFCTFLLYGMSMMHLKYGENEVKRAKSCIFRTLKALQNKGY